MRRSPTAPATARTALTYAYEIAGDRPAVSPRARAAMRVAFDVARGSPRSLHTFRSVRPTQRQRQKHHLRFRNRRRLKSARDVPCRLPLRPGRRDRVPMGRTRQIRPLLRLRLAILILETATYRANRHVPPDRRCFKGVREASAREGESLVKKVAWIAAILALASLSARPAAGFALSTLNGAWCDADVGCSYWWTRWTVATRSPDILELYLTYKEGPGLHFRGRVSGSAVKGAYYPLSADLWCAARYARTVSGTVEPSRISLSLPPVWAGKCEGSGSVVPARTLTIVRQ
jgi:hypothetical protein